MITTEQNEIISEQGANRSKKTREIENKEQATLISEQGANRSKETREIENKEQATRKELENVRIGGKPLDRH